MKRARPISAMMISSAQPTISLIHFIAADCGLATTPGWLVVLSDPAGTSDEVGGGWTAPPPVASLLDAAIAIAGAARPSRAGISGIRERTKPIATKATIGM